MKKIFLLLTAISHLNLSAQQEFSEKIAQNFPKNNMFIFGEYHFVQEKSLEIKAISEELIEKLTIGDTLFLFIEMPYSFNKIAQDFCRIGISKSWDDYFLAVGFNQDQLSPYWRDYKNLLIDIKFKCSDVGVHLKIIGVDVEKGLLRTVHGLKSYLKDEKYSTISNSLDSIIENNNFSNNDYNRKFLSNVLSELLMDTVSNNYKDFSLIMEGMRLDCSFCKARDAQMFKNFQQNTSPNHAMSIGIFGSRHLMDTLIIAEKKSLSKLDFANRTIEQDSLPYPSFFNLFGEGLKRKSIIICVAAQFQGISFSNYKKEVELFGFSEKERKYLKSRIEPNGVIKIDCKADKDLIQVSKKIDYLILYDHSKYPIK